METRTDGDPRGVRGGGLERGCGGDRLEVCDGDLGVDLGGDFGDHSASHGVGRSGDLHVDLDVSPAADRGAGLGGDPGTGLDGGCGTESEVDPG